MKKFIESLIQGVGIGVGLAAVYVLGRALHLF